MAKAKESNDIKQAEGEKTVSLKDEQLKHAEVVAEATLADTPPEANIKVEKVIAKAGKRSAKALKEDEEKQAKEAKKSSSDTTKTDSAPKSIEKAPRTRAERAGKKYREAVKQIDKTKLYPLQEALELAVMTSPTKFDASVEIHINLGVDPKQADQNVRGTVALPAGSGKTVRIAALVDGEEAQKAKTAGAQITGVEEILGKLEKEEIGFDVLIATPNVMSKLGKYARLLGPRGLMPNPKSGTVTKNVEEAVKEAKAGRVEYRVDSTGIIHLSVGKVSFGKDKLRQNTEAVLSSVRMAKPASLKSIYIKSIFLTSTMGPSIKVQI